MTSMTAVTDQHRQQYSEVLLARAAPLFEQTALAAGEAGLHAQVHVQGTPPELCLQVSRDADSRSSHYLIRLDSDGRVLHQLLLVPEGSCRRLSAGLESINSMVLDTQLDDLFREAFQLSLPELRERHPEGFW